MSLAVERIHSNVNSLMAATGEKFTEQFTAQGLVKCSDFYLCVLAKSRHQYLLFLAYLVGHLIWILRFISSEQGGAC